MTSFPGACLAPLCAGRFDMNIRSSVLAAALTGSIFALTPSVSQAQWPDIREAKAIAEEGFIYGLPIVTGVVVAQTHDVRKIPPSIGAPTRGFILRQDLFDRNDPNNLRSDYHGPPAQPGQF
jgi:hypothetical protein